MAESSKGNFCCSFSALNIIDYEKRCLDHLYSKVPDIKVIFFSLEFLERECKLIADRSGIEYDAYSVFNFLRDMALTIPLATVFLDSLVKINYSLFKSKLFNDCNNLIIHEYMHHIEKILQTPFRVPEFQTILQKFLKVYNILELQPELSYENLYQYEFLAELLKHCHEKNVRDSQLVISLLKMVINTSVNDSSDIRHVRQPSYPQDFFKYILDHVKREKFDIVAYTSDHPRTLWEYSKQFSVVHATSFGNVERALCLLQHGFNVLSSNEVRDSGHGYSFFEESMPQSYLMILQIMTRIRVVNCFTFDLTQISDPGLYTATADQTEAFRLIWRAISEPYARRADLALAISTEYFYLALHGIYKPFRYSRNMKLGMMYEKCFMDMAIGPSKPRSMKHLCRCTIRKSLHEAWNLPKGVNQLGLPKLLVKYLNLEAD